jgi:hypothetical protein
MTMIAIRAIHRDFDMIKDGCILATAAALTGAFAPDGTICVDNHLLCAPLPIQMGDLPSERGPEAPHPALRAANLSVIASTGSTFHGVNVNPWPIA